MTVQLRCRSCKELVDQDVVRDRDLYPGKDWYCRIKNGWTFLERADGKKGELGGSVEPSS